MASRIRAVGYTRMSTGKREQETSPEQQRHEIERFAQESGYRIVQWYADDAVSGDDTRKRHGFKRMVADAENGGGFDAILVWNRERFGRFDAIESGFWSHKLRSAGVQLVTVNKGVIDWDSFAGRVTDSVDAEAKHQFLDTLSGDVSRALKIKANKGGWAFGLTPFGYILGDDSKLVPDPETSPLVPQLFDKYAAGWSLRELGDWLESKGIRTRRGKKWSPTTVSDLLANEHYLGRLTYGRTSSSKYRHKVPKGRRIDLPADQWIVVKDSHPPLVTQQQFDAVQERRKKNRRNTGPKKMNGEFALKGLVSCGCCGGPMDGWFNPQRGVRQYICRAYTKSADSCQRFIVDESDILRHVIEAIQSEVFDRLDDATMKAIRQRMTELTAQRQDVIEVDRQHMRKIENQLAQAKRRLVEVDTDMVRHVTERIRELEDEQARLSDHIAANSVDAANQVELAEQRIDAAMGLLGRLSDVVASGDYDPRPVREMVGQMVQSVTVNVVREPIGKRKHRCRLTGGVIHFRIAGMPADLARFIFGDSSTCEVRS
ncbi:recombinase family protein [Crateriforma conspicua]|uniref:recombinase family protein n=1 Tax=Crateriforma conspicua TaxID=2527996 RepID=UPI001189F5C5|nr:recombinase family protein [Crateriforma conspicua]QDV66171.1 Recombinase [Crateriforma conspicua]